MNEKVIILIFEASLVLGACSALGFLSSWLCLLLDEVSGFGHILYSFRLRKAKKYFSQSVGEEITKQAFSALDEKIRSDKTFERASKRANDFMLQVAKINPKFMLWICPVCFSTRLLLIIVSPVFLAATILYQYPLTPLFFSVIIFNYFFIVQSSK